MQCRAGRTISARRWDELMTGKRRGRSGGYSFRVGYTETERAKMTHFGGPSFIEIHLYPFLGTFSCCLIFFVGCDQDCAVQWIAIGPGMSLLVSLAPIIRVHVLFQRLAGCLGHLSNLSSILLAQPQNKDLSARVEHQRWVLLVLIFPISRCQVSTCEALLKASGTGPQKRVKEVGSVGAFVPFCMRAQRSRGWAEKNPGFQEFPTVYCFFIGVPVVWH